MAPRKAEPLNLALWLPSMFLLGLATFALIFGFVVVCNRV